MSVQFADYVCDNGLAAFSSANAIYLCSQRPQSYFEAAFAYAVGFKQVTSGPLFTPPIDDINLIGRAVVSSPITEGQVLTEGLALRWAAVDTANQRLIASGSLSNPVMLREGQSFSLSPWVVTRVGELIAPFDFMDANDYILSPSTMTVPALQVVRNFLKTSITKAPPTIGAPIFAIQKRVFTTSGLTLAARTIGAPPLTQIAPITIGEPVTIYSASPALGINDPTNTNTTFRVVVPITQAGQTQIRVTLKPGTDSTDLTILGLGVGEYVDASQGSTQAPIIEGLFSGQHGFVGSKVAKTSDWIDISSLSLQIGDKVVISYTTGGINHASLSYNASQPAGTVTYWSNTNNWNTQDVSAIPFNERLNYNFGVVSIETRTYNYFPVSFDSTFYTFDSTKITFDNQEGPDVVGLSPSSITKTAPSFTAPTPIVPTFAIIGITNGPPRITDASDRLLGSTSITKGAPTLGAPSLAISTPFAGTASSFTRTAPTVGAPALVAYVPAPGTLGIPPSITRSALTFSAPTLSSGGSADTYADGQPPTSGYHWSFVTDDSDSSQITNDATTPIVDLEAN